jgi:hypothetical protein
MPLPRREDVLGDLPHERFKHVPFETFSVIAGHGFRTPLENRRDVGRESVISSEPKISPGGSPHEEIQPMRVNGLINFFRTQPV